MSNWLNDLTYGAVTQGVNQTTFLVLNVCLFLAVISLLSLLFMSIHAFPALVPHVAVLLGLALGLWFLISWFIANIGLVDPAAQQKELDVQPSAPEPTAALKPSRKKSQ